MDVAIHTPAPGKLNQLITWSLVLIPATIYITFTTVFIYMYTVAGFDIISNENLFFKKSAPFKLMVIWGALSLYMIRQTTGCFGMMYWY